MNYNGYVYLWYDTISKFYYLGGHWGKVEDRYVCSNTAMLRAYKLRPQTFKLKVLQYVIGSKTDLREAEQYWLDLIKDRELMTTDNVKSGTCRYYNVKKCSAGGNGSANKGNSNIGGWNRGKSMTNINGNAMAWKITDPLGKVHITNRTTHFCRERNLRWSSLYLAWQSGQMPKRGKHSGYKVERINAEIGL